ncbi:hypothetical protein EJ05DRAFT_472615 [Pseudovirgaria hyperparasitica]|uniref:Glycan binding protein Y3-like domain-containing protein n=1 Tax=Pseudovirgaria hyperparasitica TaxID=470096 RepID=A0A6A6WFP1_9PEZI|nr:uncharacterized protein EJ05DRAFT_472615 [Pseudovirgaria hyperparasitica]KAF2761642.1 hypothetical protein EJ05DRAFT_472615 [Pseudovirgaria hyperparasitica]
MHLTPTIVAVLTSVSLARATGCYSKGSAYWGSGDNIERAKENANRACHGNLGGRDFNAGEERKACFNIADNKRVNFIMSYKQNDPKRHMSTADCNRHLGDLITRCDRGGDGDDGKWYYRSDPNDGRC